MWSLTIPREQASSVQTAIVNYLEKANHIFVLILQVQCVRLAERGRFSKSEILFLQLRSIYLPFRFIKVCRDTSNFHDGNLLCHLKESFKASFYSKFSVNYIGAVNGLLK